MGLVVAAHDPVAFPLVAIKLVAGDDEQARRRLVREAQAMARLSHRTSSPCTRSSGSAIGPAS